MNQKLKRRLTETGIHVDEAIERMLGHEDFYLQLLKKFTSDKNYNKLQQALRNSDFDAAFQAAHTLKGLSGDLSITVLFIPLTEITNALRNRNIAQALTYMQSFSALYNSVITTIESIPLDESLNTQPFGNIL